MNKEEREKELLASINARFEKMQKKVFNVAFQGGAEASLLSILKVLEVLNIKEINERLPMIEKVANASIKEVIEQARQESKYHV